MATILHTSVDPGTGARTTLDDSGEVGGVRQDFREHATWAWFRDHEAELPKDWNVVHALLKTGEAHKFDYDRRIRAFWGRDDLLIWERDMIPYSVEQILGIFACPELSCAIDYPLTRCYILEVETKDGRSLTANPRDSHLLVCAEHQVEMSMMRDIKDKGEPTQDAVWNDGSWTHCDVPPLGLTRLRKEVMQRFPPNWPATQWLDVDQMVGDTLAMNGIRTHIHLPMARHMRKFQQTECVFVATLERKFPIAPLKFILPEFRARILAKHREVWRHTEFPRVVV